jgi:ornithine decarboxylase
MVGSYYVFDLDFLDRAIKDWMPGIKPYYAVKCNPHPHIIQRLIDLGTGFDCASLAEIKLVLSKGCTDIIYANPCKHPDDLSEAYKLGIKTTTVDSVSEVYKISKYPMDVMLRIRADDPKAKCQLGNKYGAQEQEWDDIFIALKKFNLNLTGISFHVGSGSQSETAYEDGVKKAVRAARLSMVFGFDPKIIDIGGGFTYGKLPSLKFMDHLSGFTVIAEPGRYFAENVATLYTPVIGYKDKSVTIDESLYGSFNCIVFDHAKPRPRFRDGRPTTEYTLFGCTCDGIDVIYQSIHLPQLKIGDEIEWPNMGAYTMAATTTFNGIQFQSRKVFLLK